MLRGGEMSQSLWDFQTAALVSRSLEEYKRKTRYGTASARYRARLICADCDKVIDHAWEMIAKVAETDPLASEIVADHYLFGDGWHDVASSHGMALDACKKRAYEAIKSLDGEPNGR